MQCVKGRVMGRVQGVGFRYYAQQAAQAAGVSGYAKNLVDGSVEVLLVGPSSRLVKVQQMIGTGPPGASVSSIEWEGQTPSTVLGFQIY